MTNPTTKAEQTEDEMLRETIADSLGKYVDRIINDDEPLNHVGCEFDSPTRADIEYTISVRDCGTERHKLDIHAPEERYEFGISTSLDHGNKDQISDIQTMLYALLDELFPNDEHVVNTDYPSGHVNATFRATEDEIVDSMK